jgi:hypothetical protein
LQIKTLKKKRQPKKLSLSDNFIVIRRHKSREYDSDMQMFQEYFSTKDKAVSYTSWVDIFRQIFFQKRTLLIIGKYFVIFYIVTGYIVGLDGEVPEVLFVVGLLSLYLKFLF